MTGALAALAVSAAWLGASLVALAGGARGRGLGLALAAVGAGGVVALSGATAVAAALLLGGFAAATALATGRPRTWELLPAGSAPVITLCIVMGVLGTWLGTTLLPGPEGGARRTAALVLVAIGSAVLLRTRTAAQVPAAGLLVGLAVGVTAS